VAVTGQEVEVRLQQQRAKHTLMHFFYHYFAYSFCVAVTVTVQEAEVLRLQQQRAKRTTAADYGVEEDGEGESSSEDDEAEDTMEQAAMQVGRSCIDVFCWERVWRKR
jgi:hypothetical protein